MKNPQFYSDLAKILAILPTDWLIILTKFDEDWTEIVDFLLLVYFWASVIFKFSFLEKLQNRHYLNGKYDKRRSWCQL